MVNFEVACAWDPLVGTREQEKRAKYQQLYSRNLSVAWIDYRKAFDLIPHAWIGKMLSGWSEKQ